MRAKLKAALQRVFPDLYFAIVSYRFARYCKREFGPLQNEFRQKVYGTRPIAILSGPFRGLNYFDRTVWGPITPKWIGSYEAELHGVTQKIIETGYSTIIDVGAAEGYYAVGLAARSPSACVWSFDVDPVARRRQRELARLNGVSNLSIGKYCCHKSLERFIDSQTLVICDIEGFEYELLDPAKAPALARADLLVEIHPFNAISATGVRAKLEERFSSSHRIHHFQTEPQNPAAVRAAVPELSGLDKALLEKALNEHRPAPQEWLWMERNRAGSGVSP